MLTMFLMGGAQARETSDASLLTPPKPALQFGLFGSLEFRTNNLTGIKQWGRILNQVPREKINYATCDLRGTRCHPRIRAWRKMMVEISDLPERDQLRKLNKFVNHARPYREDIDNYGRADHWTSPIEFLKSRAGDCEDFAITKFFSLLELGYTNEQMRVVVLKDRRRRIAHAVLAVKIGDVEYILDSLSDRLVAHQYALHYKPIYSVNLTTRWAHIATVQIANKFANYIADLETYRQARAKLKKPAKDWKKTVAELRPAIYDQEAVTRRGASIAPSSWTPVLFN